MTNGNLKSGGNAKTSQAVALLLSPVLILGPFHHYYMVSPLGMMELGGTLLVVMSAQVLLTGHTLFLKFLSPLARLTVSSVLGLMSTLMHERFSVIFFVIVGATLLSHDLRQLISHVPEILFLNLIYPVVRYIFAGAILGVSAGSEKSLGTNSLGIIPRNFVVGILMVLHFFEDAIVYSNIDNGPLFFKQWLSQFKISGLLTGCLLVLLLFVAAKNFNGRFRRRLYSNNQLIEIFGIVSLAILSGLLASTSENRIESRWFFIMFISFVILLSPRFHLISPQNLLVATILLVSVLFTTYTDSQKTHDFSQRVRWAELITDLNEITAGLSSWQFAVTDTWQPTYLNWITRDGEIFTTFLSNPPSTVNEGWKSCPKIKIRCIYADLRKSGHIIYEITHRQANILAVKSN